MSGCHVKGRHRHSEARVVLAGKGPATVLLSGAYLDVTLPGGRVAPLEAYYPKCPKCGGFLLGEVRKGSDGKAYHDRCAP
jgi:hypothetical protein